MKVSGSCSPCWFLFVSVRLVVVVQESLTCEIPSLKTLAFLSQSKPSFTGPFYSIIKVISFSESTSVSASQEAFVHDTVPVKVTKAVPVTI